MPTATCSSTVLSITLAAAMVDRPSSSERFSSMAKTERFLSRLMCPSA